MSHRRSSMSDYAELRTLPAILGIFFSVASLYQFGGISTVELTWIGYTLTAEHATIVSLVVLVIAFASSETRQYENYSDEEKLLIVAGPVLILAYQYVDLVNNTITNNDPFASAVAWTITMVAWGVAVR